MKMLLTVCAVLGAVVAQANPTLQRSMLFSTWARLARECHVRIAQPPIANTDGTHEITFTGTADQLACAEKLLAKPRLGATP